MTLMCMKMMSMNGDCFKLGENFLATKKLEEISKTYSKTNRMSHCSLGVHF